jgi:hypothetical protein
MDYFTGQAGMGGGIPPFNQEDQTIPATATETSGMLPAQSPLGFGGGQQPGLGQPGQSGQGGFFDTVGANRNALVGLGLGLMGGQFGNRFGQAQQGYQAGAAQDASITQHQQSQALQQQHLALQREQMALTADIKEYQYTKSQGYKGSFQDWLQQKNEQANKQYGTVQQIYVPKDQAAYAKDPNNYSGGYDLKFYQPTSRGGFVEAAGLPPGATPAQINKMIQTPEGLMPVPQRLPPPSGAAPSTSDTSTPGTAAPAGPTSGTVIPGTSLADKARETDLGKRTSAAIATLPELETTTVRMMSRLNELEKHPNLGMATGVVAGNLPTIGPTADVGARIAEIQGQNWTLGIQTMRGMGALSDREGARIDQARSRLASRNVSTEDYKKAISDIREVLQTGLENARKIASGKMKPYTPSTEAPAATTGGSDRTAAPSRDDYAAELRRRGIKLPGE